MSIPKWRYEKDSDDGCNIYQCLSCYQSYEGRSSPTYWSYCPYCGVKWEGEHKWLIHGDNWDIITPARMNRNRYVDKAKPYWEIQLQENSLFKCNDGAYIPLHSKWDWVHEEKYHITCFKSDSSYADKWDKIHRECIKKYGNKYGGYIYYRKFINSFLKDKADNKDHWHISHGCDYRVVISLHKHYGDKGLEEYIVDLGGWRQVDEKCIVRQPNTLFEHDDLQGHYRDHGEV